MNRRLLLLLILLTSVGSAIGQNSFAVTGYVLDERNGNPVSGARVSCERRNTETFTNRYGYFSLFIPTGEVPINISYQGYVSKEVLLEDIDGTRYITIELSHAIYNYLETDFESRVQDSTILSNPLSNVIDVSIGTLKQMPFLFSENDVVKGLQMFPGVDFGIEGTSDLLVRGGTNGQNLMTLDGMPIYSQGHFLGYISNFNTGIINDVQLYKGSFPARYGGRVSSVVDITSTAGSSKDVHGTLAISPILANLNLGIPLSDNGTSMSLNWRRSYIDLLTGGFLSDELKFGDFHSKLDVKLSEKDHIQLTYYSLNDAIGLSLDSDDSTINTSYDLSMSGKNYTTLARWNHSFNARLFSSVSAGYSGFKHAQQLVEKNPTPLPGNPHRIETDIAFQMRDYSVNADFEFNKDEKHLLRFGMQNTIHSFLPGQLQENRYDSIKNLLSSEVAGSASFTNTFESGLYVEDEFNYSDRIKVNLGMRASVYSGGGLFNIYPEPRISARYKVDSAAAVKVSYARMNQFLHLYNNGGNSNDVMVWIPADEILKPENSNQLTFSYVRRIKKKWDLQSDLYYKTLGNQLLFYSIQYFDDPNYERNALIGSGSGYGFETLLKFSDQALSAQFGYDYSVARRKFDQLNRGETFYYDFDRRHFLKANLVASIDQWIFSLNTVAATGNPFTLPNAKYRDLDGRVVLSYDEINNYRSNTYFRVDAKLQYFWGDFEDYGHSLELTIYNLSGNENTSIIYTELDREVSGEKYSAIRESRFLFFPSISYKLTI